MTETFVFSFIIGFVCGIGFTVFMMLWESSADENFDDLDR